MRLALTPHGASRMVQLAMSAWWVRIRRAPSRRCRDGRLYGHTTMAMHDMSTPPPSFIPNLTDAFAQHDGHRSRDEGGERKETEEHGSRASGGLVGRDVHPGYSRTDCHQPYPEGP